MGSEGSEKGGEIGVTAGIGNLVYRQVCGCEKCLGVFDTAKRHILMRRGLVGAIEHADNVIGGIGKTLGNFGHGNCSGKIIRNVFLNPFGNQKPVVKLSVVPQKHFKNLIKSSGNADKRLTSAERGAAQPIGGSVDFFNIKASAHG